MVGMGSNVFFLQQVVNRDFDLVEPRASTRGVALFGRYSYGANFLPFMEE